MFSMYSQNRLERTSWDRQYVFHYSSVIVKISYRNTNGKKNVCYSRELFLTEFDFASISCNKLYPVINYHN